MLQDNPPQGGARVRARPGESVAQGEVATTALRELSFVAVCSSRSQLLFPVHVVQQILGALSMPFHFKFIGFRRRYDSFPGLPETEAGCGSCKPQRTIVLAARWLRPRPV